MWLSCWLFAISVKDLAGVSALPSSRTDGLPLARTDDHENEPQQTATGLSTIALLRRELSSPERVSSEQSDSAALAAVLLPPAPAARPPSPGTRNRLVKRKANGRDVSSIDVKHQRQRGLIASRATISANPGHEASMLREPVGGMENTYVVRRQEQLPDVTPSPGYESALATTPAPMVIVLTATTSGAAAAYSASYDDAEADVPHRISMSTLVCIIFSGTILALWIAWRNLKKVYESRRENDIFMDMLAGLGDDNTKQRASKLWGQIRGAALTLLTGESDSGHGTDKDDSSSAKEDKAVLIEAKPESAADADAVHRRDSGVGAADMAAGGAPDAPAAATMGTGTARERRGRRAKATASPAETPAAVEAPAAPGGEAAAAPTGEQAPVVAAPVFSGTTEAAVLPGSPESQIPAAETVTTMSQTLSPPSVAEAATDEPRSPSRIPATSPAPGGGRSRRERAFEKAGLAPAAKQAEKAQELEIADETTAASAGAELPTEAAVLEVAAAPETAASAAASVVAADAAGSADPVPEAAVAPETVASAEASVDIDRSAVAEAPEVDTNSAAADTTTDQAAAATATGSNSRSGRRARGRARAVEETSASAEAGESMPAAAAGAGGGGDDDGVVLDL